MSSSKSSRGLMSALILALPIVALTPSAVYLRIDGAHQVDPLTWVAYEGTTVVMTVQAEPNDLVALFAKAVDGPSTGLVATLMIEKAGADGAASAPIRIPDGFAGESFELVAFAMNPAGEISSTPPALVRIR